MVTHEKPVAIVVRTADDDDQEFLVAANSRMARETEGKELDAATLALGVRAALSDARRGFYLIAEVDGHRAGSLLVTQEWSDWRNGWFWWIQSVYVNPEARRRGVYRALHEEVLQRAARSGDACAVRLYVDRDNERARQVYRRLGMELARYELMEQDLERMRGSS